MGLQERLFELIKQGGTLATKEEVAFREKACAGCEYFGTVRPVPGIEALGCTLCGCPQETKGKLKSYFSLSKLETVKAVCSLSYIDTITRAEVPYQEHLDRWLMPKP